MFRRKKDDDADDKGLPEFTDELGIPVKPGARPPGTIATAARPAPAAMAGQLPRAAEPPRPTEPTRRSADAPAASTATAPTPPSPKSRDHESRRLIVGREISLSGEITSCDRLVVEGSVEANLANCRDIDIAESGLFKGSASIEDAEIRGRFEGTLNVRRRLLIRSSGRVIGTVRYGQIEIECGGQISGDVQAQPMAEPSDKPSFGASSSAFIAETAKV